MQVHNIEATLAGAEELDFRVFEGFNGGTTGVYHATGGTSPWAIHPDGDTILYVISGDGGMEVTLLGETGEEQEHETVVAHAGELVVVPGGHWYRQRITGSIVQLWATAGRTRHSRDRNPRHGEAD